MTASSIGITVILAILVPVLFQVVSQGLKQDRRHREILDRLDQLEKSTRSIGKAQGA